MQLIFIIPRIPLENPIHPPNPIHISLSPSSFLLTRLVAAALRGRRRRLRGRREGVAAATTEGRGGRERCRLRRRRRGMREAAAAAAEGCGGRRSTTAEGQRRLRRHRRRMREAAPAQACGRREEAAVAAPNPLTAARAPPPRLTAATPRRRRHQGQRRLAFRHLSLWWIRGGEDKNSPRPLVVVVVVVITRAGVGSPSRLWPTLPVVDPWRREKRGEEERRRELTWRGCPRHPLEEVEEPMTGLIYCVATRRARSMLPEPTSGEGEQLELVPSLDLPAELAADLVTISHFVLQSLPSFPILCRSPRGSPTDLVPRSYAAIIVAVSSSMPLTSRRSRRCPIELGFLRAICAAMERHLGVVAGVGEREGWWWP
ncbi:hypothetical protein [Oryza sativa Japonica Group]|uniref:Uncharacterized protein n=3 Tax=Oryza TaxID=4527 RepID=Q5ZDB3_ORYSJ|nr:hypothetical protein [Oryza sativa Japonica Group]